MMNALLGFLVLVLALLAIVALYIGGTALVIRLVGQRARTKAQASDEHTAHTTAA